MIVHTSLTLILLLLLTGLGLAAPQDSPAPNILLLVSDDQGYADLGCFGNQKVRTPHLDRLAAEGVRLTNFYVTCPACTPSRGSLLTGRYPQRNGTYELFRNKAVDLDHLYSETDYAASAERVLGMDTREVLLSQLLSQAGYDCGMVGKWDLGQLRRYLPLQRGFDFFYGFVNTGIDYWTHERYGIGSMYRGNEAIREDRGTYSTDLFRREALRFVSAERRRPFFLYLAFNAPHAASNLERPRPGVQAPEDYIRQYEDVEAEPRQKIHMAAVTAMDETIGEVLALLQDSGAAEDTIVIFMSDNGGAGPADNGPLRGRKALLFEGGVRVPCIVRWPGRIPAGTVSDAFLSALEIVPTLLTSAGVAVPSGLVLDGFDIMDVLTGKGESPREEMFWEFRGQKAARVGDWKWVESSAGSSLFNLDYDISEQQDFAQHHPEVLARIKRRFDQWKSQMQAAEPRRPFRDY